MKQLKKCLRSPLLCQCINGLRSLDAVQPAVCLNVVLMWLFIYCYFGDQVTSRFEHIQLAFYESNWHLLPLELMNCLPYILLSTQKLVYIRGFANSSCTRETFKMVSVLLSKHIFSPGYSVLLPFRLSTLAFRILPCSGK